MPLRVSITPIAFFISSRLTCVSLFRVGVAPLTPWMKRSSRWLIQGCDCGVSRTRKIQMGTQSSPIAPKMMKVHCQPNQYTIHPEAYVPNAKPTNCPDPASVKARARSLGADQVLVALALMGQIGASPAPISPRMTHHETML